MNESDVKVNSKTSTFSGCIFRRGRLASGIRTIFIDFSPLFFRQVKFGKIGKQVLWRDMRGPLEEIAARVDEHIGTDVGS